MTPIMASDCFFFDAVEGFGLVNGLSSSTSSSKVAFEGIGPLFFAGALDLLKLNLRPDMVEDNNLRSVDHPDIRLSKGDICLTKDIAPVIRI